MKVAFIGTHGVGKTTLCFDLAARLKRLDLGVDIVKEVARDAPLPINRETTLEAQAWILHTQIAGEITACARYEAVICDRSVLDNYAYMVHRVGRRREYDPLVRRWVKTYTALCKVPVLQTPSFDGTRDVSATFQAEIDRGNRRQPDTGEDRARDSPQPRDGGIQRQGLPDQSQGGCNSLNKGVPQRAGCTR